MSSDNRILIFARYPVPGEAKTRLIPSLGPEGAARLHRRMTEKAVAMARAALVPAGKPDAEIMICCAGAPIRAFRAWLGQDLHYAKQPSGDIGVRMGRAFRSTLKHSAAAFAIGTDVPDITPAILAQAFEILRSHDVVLGPAGDGGYYLIGMKRYHPELFSGIEWGTERVWNQTLQIISKLGLKVAKLPMLSDVDRPEDLPAVRKDSYFSDCFAGKALLSVIIPTLNEAAGIGKVLDRVREETAAELIVVDGGSMDRTREIAAQAGALVMEVAGGRSHQQNAGALAAKGRLLLFLHGDTLLPENYGPVIRKTLDDPSKVAGAFRFRTDGSGTSMRIIEWGANVRSRVMQAPYGDQGLFMEKRVFEEMGGFAPIPIMEDFELVLRLRRRGSVVTLRESIITSARRWRQLGPIRTTIVNMIMVAGFYCGVSMERLHRFYRILGLSPAWGHRDNPPDDLRPGNML
jgi:uncharacterized protein